jgi:hypothetical protein
MLVGTIVLIDLRVLDFALTRIGLQEIRRRFEPWTRAGLAIMLATGPILFAADITRYTKNPAFLFKMIVLFAALVFHFDTHTRPDKYGKLGAVISIALWTFVVLGGRAIADFDI